MEDLEIKIEDGRLRLCIEDKHSRFEDSIMPKQHLIHIFPIILFRESCYFEDTVKLRIFRLRTIYNIFQKVT